MKAKRNKFRWSGACTKGQGTQPIHGRWATGQGIQRVSFGDEKKRGSILGFPLKLLWGKCSTMMASYLKEVSMGCDHMIHAIEVSDKVA